MFGGLFYGWGEYLHQSLEWWEDQFVKNKIELVREEMIVAMKQHNTMRKNTLSMLLQSLQKAEKDKIGISLTDAEADSVVMKEIKQTHETLDTCPADRTDIIEECKQRIAILQEFAPKQLNKEEIEAVIREVFTEIGIESPTKKEKGKIMKVLMPKVKGKADGKLVNQILDSLLS